MFSETLTAPVRYGGVMRRYPPSLWDSARAAIGCAAFLAVLLLVGVVLYLLAPSISPYVFEWMGYVTCYVQRTLSIAISSNVFCSEHCLLLELGIWSR